MEQHTYIELTAEIVSAHVSNNSVAAGDIAQLIASVHQALVSSGEPAAPVEDKPTPAVSIRSSVKPDKVSCLECGEKMTMLKRHLSTEHDMTPADYRARWKLPADYPMIAPNYAAKRADIAKKIGLGRKSGGKSMEQPAAKPVPAKRTRKP